MPLSRTWPAVAILGLGGWLATGPAIADAAPALESRSAPILSERGVQYRDLNRNGRLDPYEDRRLPPAVRAQDLVRRMRQGDVEADGGRAGLRRAAVRRLHAHEVERVDRRRFLQRRAAN